MGDAGELGLYVHIPFCRSRCRYCDFNSYDGISYFIPEYLSALEKEARVWSPLLINSDFVTVYVGGGTPTVLDTYQLEQLMRVLYDSFHMSSEVEITVEVNPESAGVDKLRLLNSVGVNRLSIGVQSLIDTELKMLGRCHSVADTMRAYHIAREIGFENVNIDLIYGLPEQTLSRWRSNIEQAIQLNPEHLSLYALTLEPHTVLADEIVRGLLPEPSPDLTAEMYQLAEEMLASAGYRHYEISNWALTGYECRHNVGYWKNGRYVGLGAGAHSHLGACRFANVASPFEYERCLRQNDFKRPEGFPEEYMVVLPWQALADGGWPVASFECLDRRTILYDSMMLGLRLIDGLNTETLLPLFDRSIEDTYHDELRRLAEDGLIEKEGNIVRLSAKGRLLSNEVFVRLLRQLRNFCA